MDGLIDRWMDGWMDEWMDEWMDVCMYVCMSGTARNNPAFMGDGFEKPCAVGAAAAEVA